MPPVDIILIEVPDEVGGYGAKGVGEIGCVATAGAVAGALHAYDGIRRFRLPMDDAPAAAPSLPEVPPRKRKSGHDHGYQVMRMVSAESQQIDLSTQSLLILSVDSSATVPSHIIAPDAAPAGRRRGFRFPQPRCRARGALGDRRRRATGAGADAGGDPARSPPAPTRVLVTYAKITAEMIAQMTRCRIISRFGIGVDNVDLAAATSAGIVVTKVPDYCIDEVSDHAVALLLALVRKIPLSNAQVHAGRWEMKAVVPIHRLRGTVLGLVGFGRIPQLVAPKAKAFGMRVIASDPFVPAEVFAREGVERVEFAELLKQSDYVSIHTPLLPETRGLFNAEVVRSDEARRLPGQHGARADRGRGGARPRRWTRASWPARRST